MAFDILVHILDHTHSVINNLSDKPYNHKHFNTMIDVAYFIAAGYSTQEEIDHIMMKIIHNLNTKKLLVF